ncbi:PI-PLC X domain-containing protein 3-like [Rhopilema esculentum]|uniref:PI-PLC X domain-containing protein 3-like n=1 Tax=Rhopilema esculentum TaxID=499914 RepID=UPI0031D3B0D9|eukprot:gene16440-7853_t
MGDSLELDLENWMAQLPTNLQCVPVNKLAIPGSHDSGAFYLDKTSKIAPDESKAITTLVRIFGQCAKNIVYKWSITQTLSLHQQLANGVRYFDLRVAYEDASKEYCFVHGLYGQAYQAIFSEMKQFLDKHPKEVVILDFNHLWGFTEKDCSTFLEIIEKSFGDVLYGPGTKSTNCCLKDLWDAKKQIIALYDNEEAIKKNPNFWPRSTIYSPWYDTANITDLLNHLNGRFDTLKEDCYNVFQAILSPQTSTIVLHLANGSLKTTLAENCDKMVSSWLKKVHDEKKKGINIVICDFVDLLEFARKVVSLNYM